jgi:hypothetical protein
MFGLSATALACAAPPPDPDRPMNAAVGRRLFGRDGASRF